MSRIERFETRSWQSLAPRYPLTLKGRTRWCAVAERPAAQRFPTMRCQPVCQLGTLRHDACRVDVGMHDVVVLLDLDEVDRVAKTRRLEQVSRVGPQHRHLRALAPIALEVSVVDVIYAGQCGEQPDIGFGDRVADKVPLLCKSVAHPIERGEQPVVR